MMGGGILDIGVKQSIVQVNDRVLVTLTGF